MKASVIIPVWNGRRHLSDCLEALLGQDYPDFEVIAVDNASTDGSADLIAESYPQVRVIRNDLNLGFAGGCNVGLRVAKGGVLILLNQDVVVQPGWLPALVDGHKERGVGIAGAKLLEPDRRTLSHAGAYLDWPLGMGVHVGAGEVDRGQYDIPRDVEYVTGACLAVASEVVADIGLLDEDYYPAFYEDVDFCWRAREAGWRVKYEPRAAALHDEASSTRHHWLSRHYYHYRNRMVFILKHFTPSQIAREFVPAEKERISSLPADELRAGHVALTEILSMWSLIAGGLTGPERPGGDRECVLEALRTLREQIVEQQGGESALRRPKPYHGEARTDGQSTVTDEALANELMSLWEVREQPFTSQVPVLAPLIVAFRRLWNSVATKWYVRPMMAQQVKFNGAVVRALSRLRGIPGHYWDSDALVALLAERCGAMTGRSLELEERLAQIEAQMVDAPVDRGEAQYE